MCMKLRQTVSRNVWWWQSNRGLCSTMWSGCWGKLTGNSIIGRLPPLNGNGDDDGFNPPHHNNAVLPHHLDLGIELPPTPHVGPLSICISNLPRNQIIEPMQLKGWGQSAKLKKHSGIWGKFGTAIQGYILNPCTKFAPNPTSRKVNNQELTSQHNA